MPYSLPKTVVELKDVYFKREGKTVLQKVDFRLYSNDFLLILGPNGGGKTTLLKLILGINKPFSGSVKLFGKSPDKKNYLIGYVPQSIRVNESFPISVKQVTMLGGVFLAISKQTLQDRVDKWLELFDLTKIANKKFSDLSGGEKQRVILARAMVGKPTLLLLDEPTKNIDVEAKELLYNFLTNIAGENTIIMVSHDLDFLPKSVNKIACVQTRLVMHEDINKLSYQKSGASNLNKSHTCLADYLVNVAKQDSTNIYAHLMEQPL